MVVPSFNVTVYTKVLLAAKLFVLMLKIHCWFVASQRKAVSVAVEETVSSTEVTVPEMIWVRRKLLTTPAAPIEVPLTSQTRN